MSKVETMDSFERSAESLGLGDILPRRNWAWLLARGLLLTVLGVVALLRPGPALLAFASVFAAFCFIDGVLSVASGVRGARNRSERWWSLLLSGVAGIVIGTLFVLFPAPSTFTLALTTVVLIAAWAVITGVFEMWAAVRLRKEIQGEWLLGLSGGLSVLVGLAIGALAALMPAVSALSVAWMVGAYALIAGVALTVLAFRLRKRPRKEAEAKANSPRQAHPA